MNYLDAIDGITTFNCGFKFHNTTHADTVKQYVTDFRKTDPKGTLIIWYFEMRITNLKYSTHCESLLLGCSQAKFTV